MRKRIVVLSTILLLVCVISCLIGCNKVDDDIINNGEIDSHNGEIDSHSLYSYYIKNKEMLEEFYGNSDAGASADDGIPDEHFIYINKDGIIDYFSTLMYGSYVDMRYVYSAILYNGEIAAMEFVFDGEESYFTEQRKQKIFDTFLNDLLRVYCNNSMTWRSFENVDNILYSSVIPLKEIFGQDLKNIGWAFVCEETETLVKIISIDADELVVPDYIKHIADKALNRNYIDLSFTKLILPDSLESIGDSALKGFGGIYLPNGLPQSLKYLGDYNDLSLVDEYGNRIDTITLPDSLEYLGDSALSSYYVTELPQNLKHLGSSVYFNYITSLPASLEYLGYAIWGRNADEKTIYDNAPDNSIIYLDGWAIAKKGELKEISIKEGTIGIAEGLLQGANVFQLPSSLKVCPQIRTNLGINGIFCAFDEDKFDDLIYFWGYQPANLSNAIYVYYNYTEEDYNSFMDMYKNDKAVIITRNDTYMCNDFSMGSGCYFLTSFDAIYYTCDDYYEVDPDNAQFCSVDGVIYTKDMSMLVAYPNFKEDESFVIPDCVKYIFDGAFNNALNLKSIEIPLSVEYIGYGAFYFWNADQTIYINERKDTPIEWDLYWDSSCFAKIIWDN